VSHTGQPGVLPLRPLTVGELLDAAVTLLRVRGPLLVGLGAAAASAEQAVLFPLRRLADVDSSYYPADDRWAAFGLLIVVGFAAEAAIIAALGGPSSAAAPRALLGGAAPSPERGNRAAAATFLVAAVVAAACGVAIATVFVWPGNILFVLMLPVTVGLWVCLYGTLGLAVPAVVIDRLDPVRAIGRSIVLSLRGFLRTMRVRVLAYFGWFVIRLAWGFGVLQLIGLGYTSPSPTVDNLLMAAVFFIVNALAYPMLACLDPVLHLEARMRTEGVDIALRRALDQGIDPTRALART
jgi:hypothetical protein